MNVHFFSAGSGDRRAVYVVDEDEVYDMSNTLIPVTSGMNRWSVIREAITPTGDDEKLGPMSYARAGVISAAGLAALHAGRAAMVAAQKGDRDGVAAAANDLLLLGVIPPIGSFFGGTEYWIDRWLRDRC